MKKTTKKCIAMTMVAVTALSFFSCNPGEVPKGVIDEEKTINVRVGKGGYGEEWLYELVDKFEKVYESDGYQVNILAPSSDMKGATAITEMMQGYDRTKVDLYITSGITPESVGVEGEYGVLAEDLKELVYNKKAISYDGTEEEQTVLEKMPVEFVATMQDSHGAWYQLPYINTAAGFVVNTKKLEKYDLELPRTTNELLDCFRKIYLGHNGVKKSEESGVYPITYVPGSSNGYTQCWNVNMVAQYDYDEFTQLMTMENADGTPMSENGYEVFNYQGIEEMLTVAYEAFDESIASPGTLSQTLDQAQAQIMRDGGAVFMANGDWMLNEVKLNYKNYLNDIEFINFPVLSSVGTKVFGTGTSYNFDEAKCEELLCYIIDLVDENKSLEEIVSAVQTEKSVTITNADAQEIATARGVYYNRGTEKGAFITKGSTKKDIAVLFLRMMASEDCANTIAKRANATSAFTRSENTATQYKFVNQASKVLVNRYAIPYVTTTSGYRKKLQAASSVLATTYHVSTMIVGEGNTIYDDSGNILAGKNYSYYRELAQSKKAYEYEQARTKLWATWKEKDK